ncbi:hypothetical protein GS500_15905 [Rhodococcus hoagii]|nr:hypothetical protein [Prescottella equi]
MPIIVALTGIGERALIDSGQQHAMRKQSPSPARLRDLLRAHGISDDLRRAC